MKIRGLEVEDFVNYKECSMFIALGWCDWKCCKEINIPITVCQNSELAKTPEKEISIERIYELYKNNPLSNAVVIGGLEPFTQESDIYKLLKYFREQGCEDTFVIYTGYYPDEICLPKELINLGNLIIKFGRYIPGDKPHYDEVLGVNLASDNQFALKLS